MARGRLVRVVAAFGLVGILLTISVAWVGFLLWKLPPQPNTPPVQGQYPWPWKQPADWPPQMWIKGWRVESALLTHEGGEGINAAHQGHVMMCYSAGWPLRALGLQRLITLTSFEERGAMAFPVRSYLSRWGNPSKRGLVPVLPLWPGFAVNTAFYGTLAFLLWSAPGFVRRKRRRRRGLCVACGYELKGMPKCPECGGNK